jgi:hypothetical protein
MSLVIKGKLIFCGVMNLIFEKHQASAIEQRKLDGRIKLRSEE